MRKATPEEINSMLVDCCGCGKKHLQVGGLLSGKNYCKSCKDELEIDVSSGLHQKKSEMTHFTVQKIYVLKPKKHLIEKSILSGKKIYTGSLHGIATNDQNLIGITDDGSKATMHELKKNDFVQKSNGNFAKVSDVARYGTTVVSKKTAVDEIIKAGMMVFGYNTKPTPIFRKGYELEHKGIGIPYLGVELEVTSELSDSAEKELSKQIIKSMEENDLLEFFYMKHDGSIGNGVELVSHPATLSQIKKLNLSKFLDDIKEIGFKDDDRCGLHIHVSRDALTKRGWWALMTMMSKLTNKFVKISRREKNAMQYCKFEGMSGGISEALLKGSGICKDNVTESNDRHMAMNFKNKNTVEFRLFRSTTDYDTLIGTLQLVEALVMFCREYSFMHIQDQRSSELWNEFTDFCNKNNYRKLIKMLGMMSLYYINQKK